MREWPRSGNCRNSVTAADFPYILKAARLTLSGIVRSTPPEMISSGARSDLCVSTAVAAPDFGVALASAAWNSGRPGPGIVHRSWSRADSSSGSALPKVLRNWPGVRLTARLRLAGLRSTGKAEASCAGGVRTTPRICAGSIAMPARPSPRSSSDITTRPPKECPIRTGGSGMASTSRAWESMTWSMPIPAWLSGCARASATVSGTPGHSGMTGS